MQADSAPDNVEQEAVNPESSPVPFETGAFDVVIDRHSSYWPSEVRRVLRRGGRFLTQQRSETGRERRRMGIPLRSTFGWTGVRSRWFRLGGLRVRRLVWVGGTHYLGVQ